MTARSRLSPIHARNRVPGSSPSRSSLTVDTAFVSAGRFKLKHEIPLLEFVDSGFSALGIGRQVASNLIIAMIKKAWLSFCRQKGFVEYHYSNAVGIHASAAQAATGQRIPWGKQGDRRSAMLRNVAKGHIWAVRRHRDALLLAILASEVQVQGPLLGRQRYARGDRHR